MTGQDGQQQVAESVEPRRDWPVGQLAEIDALNPAVGEKSAYKAVPSRWNGNVWESIDRRGAWSQHFVTAVRPLRLVPQDAVTADSAAAAITSEMLAVNTRYVGTTEAAHGYLDGLSAALRIVAAPSVGTGAAEQVDLLAVLDEGNCRHGNDPVLCGICDGPDPTAAPWAGRGTPVEEVSSGSVETEAVEVPPVLVEQIAARVHQAWMAAKAEQGVTSRRSESGEELMVPYEQLSEPAKELDRASVRAEVARYRAAIDKIRSGIGPLRQHARLVRSDPAERTYADGVNAACDLIEADLAAALGDGE